ncbi:MAG: XrtA/PEP-CTERM system TPR-repeat protein PrsT [Gammaproteobacteria bacterium]
MSRSLSLLLISLITILVACTGQESPEVLRKRAEEAYAKKEVRAAVIDLKSLLEMAPKDGQARWLLAQCYVDLGLGAAAAKELRAAEGLGIQDDRMGVIQTRVLLLQSEYEKVVDQAIGDATDENDPLAALPPDIRSELIALRGRAHAALGQYEQAHASFNAALQINPHEPEAKIGLAEDRFRQEDHEGARKLLREVVTHEPSHAAAWSALGGMELQLQNVEAAETALGNAIQHGVAPTLDLYRRALARIELKKYADAQADLQALGKQSPGFYERHFAQALLEARQENFKAAVEALQPAFNGNPKYIWPRYLSSFALYKMGQRERALEDMKIFLGEYPGYVPAQKLYAKMSLDADDVSTAKSALEIALAADENDVETLRLLAMVYGRQGKFADQTRLLDRIVALAPESEAARAELGASLLASGDETRGLAELAAARKLAPESIRSDAAMIAYYGSKGLWKEAQQVAEELAQRRKDDPTPRNLLGGIYRAQRDPARARAYFEEALALDSANKVALSNLASMAVADKKYSEARQYFERIIASHPDDLPTQLRLAKLDGVEEKLPDMVARLKKLIDAHPQATQPRLALARYHLFSGQFDEVNSALGPFGSKESTDPWVLDVLGRSRLALNQPAEAAQLFEKLTRIEPKLAEAQYLLGRALALTGDETNSRAAIEKAATLNPSHFGALLSLARLAIASDNAGTAAPLVDRLESIAPRNAEVATVAADLAALRGQSDESQKLYERAFELDANPQTLITLASERWRAGAREEAVKILGTWLESHPKDIQARTALASSYAQLDQPERAVAEYQKVLEHEPKNVLVLNNLAAALVESNPKRAVEYAEQATSIAPTFEAALDTLALAQMKSGDTAQARRTSDRLFKNADRASLDGDYYYHRALVLQAAGATSEAALALQDGLALPPGQAITRRAEAEALLRSLKK